MDPSKTDSNDDQLAKRREINRRAARKSRRKEKEYAESVRQQYFEAKSKNTTLNYEKKQLEKRRETLAVRWSTHQAACPRMLKGSNAQQLGTEATIPSTTPYHRVFSAPESTSGPSGRLQYLSVTVANENPTCPQPQLLPIEADSIHESSDNTGDAGMSRSLSCPANLSPPSSTHWSLPTVWDSNAEHETSAACCPEMVTSQSDESSDTSSSSIGSTNSTEALNEPECSGAVSLPLSERGVGGLSLLAPSNNSQESVVSTTSVENATTMPPMPAKILSPTPTGISFQSADHVIPTTLLMTPDDDSFVGDPTVPATRTDPPNCGGYGLGEVERFKDDQSNLSFSSSSSFHANVEHYEHSSQGCPSTAVDYGPCEGDSQSPLVNHDDVTGQQVDESPTGDYYDDQIPIHVRNMTTDK